MAKNKYRVTDEKIELIFKLHADGKSQYQIADQVDLSQGTVQKILAARILKRNVEAEEDQSPFFNVDKYFESLVTV